METDFDESIGLINVIPQDMGRVILNLITNAFYAVDEKKKNSPGPLSPDGGKNPSSIYEPIVSVATKHSLSTGELVPNLLREGRGEVIITVKDNGPGIPGKVLDKIFQPFFTTKPTGQGTGLGLSLSYDIVKAHGGELKVETKVGEGTTFKLLLPFEV
jgi:signal transduction histidine kinase